MEQLGVIARPGVVAQFGAIERPGLIARVSATAGLGNMERFGLIAQLGVAKRLDFVTRRAKHFVPRPIFDDEWHRHNYLPIII